MSQASEQFVSSPSRRKWLAGLPLAVAGGVAAMDLLNHGPLAAQPVDAEEKHAATPADIYDVRRFGAVGDGKVLDTRAIQTAIDACAAHGGGVVYLGPGTYLTGALELKSYVTLYLASGATLLGTADGRQYHAIEAVPLQGDATLRDGNWALIYAVNAKKIAIEGSGTIDGQGAQFRSPKGQPVQDNVLTGVRRPYHFLAYRCEDITLRGVTLRDSAYHSLRTVSCERVHMDGLYIHNRVNVNNDGFHFISTRYITVSNCVVLAQDDACALFGSCEFVTVANCTFSSRWSVFRFGGGKASNISVSNCILSRVYGCPIKLQATPGTRFENFSFSNLLLDQVTGPIFIGAVGVGSSSRSQNEFGGSTESDTSTPIVRNISFTNLHGTVVSSLGELPESALTNHAYPGEALSCIAFSCAEDARMEGIFLSDLSLVFGGGGTQADAQRRRLPASAGEYFSLGTMPSYGIYARGVRGLELSNVRLETEKPDMRPAVILEGVGDAFANGLSVQAHADAESAVRMIDCADVLVSCPRVLTPARTFLQVEGEATRGVVISGGDLSRASAAVRAEFGAKADAVVVRM